MKKILFVLVIFSLISCGKKNNSSSDNNNNLDTDPLTTLEMQTLVNNNWCEYETTIQLQYNQGGQSRNCTAELTLIHDVNRFTETEYFVEYKYSGNPVRCKKNFGNNDVIMNQAMINNQLKDRGYRMSFIGQNQAILTEVGSDDSSQEVQVFVSNNQTNIIPANKSKRPIELSRCL